MATFLDQLLLGGKANAKGPGVLRQAIAQESGRPRESHYAFLEGESEPDEVPAKASQALKQAKVEAKPIQVFRELNGFSVELTDQEAEQLRRVPSVQSVELDQPLPLTPPVTARPANQTSSHDFVPVVDSDGAQVRLDDVITGEVFSSLGNNFELQNKAELVALPVYNNGIASTGEVLPYGVQAVWDGQDVSKQGNAGTGTYAFVIDSGVLDSTGDLLVNKAWSKSWISGESAFTDGNGHGTHVAGTIAALANGVGVVGVAPGAEVISLKVFDSSGGGASYSTIISAINHAVDVINSNGLDKSKTVINMSLGGGYSYGLDVAVKNAASQGIQFAIAAGNSGQDADQFSPASAGDHSNVYTVSAVDNQYRMSSWSNWDDSRGGDDVDVAAPGVSVLSYYKGGGLAYLSGTSMAAPHVAGALLMGGVVEGDQVTANWAGNPDPFALVADSQTPEPPIEVPASGLQDDFTDGKIADFWKSISLGSINSKFTGRSESLFFSGAGTRSATTKAFDLDNGAKISFDLIYGDNSNGGEEVDPGEEVVLEYSTNGGSWNELESYAISAKTQNWGTYGAELSASLATGSTQFRWRQRTSSGGSWDQWGIDNVSIHDNSQFRYSEIQGKYIYGGGDFYEFSGIISSEFGGGNFFAGQTIGASDQANDRFDNSTNETGLQGYYLITAAQNKIGYSKDSIFITKYFDLESGSGIQPFVSFAGTGGLGSESAFLTDNKLQEFDFIDSYHEGKLNLEDLDNDGLVDDASFYHLYNSGSAVLLSSMDGRKYSDSYTDLWDVVVSAQESDGYKVLLSGGSSFEGQYHVWTVSHQGVITSGSGWKNALQSVKAGWELLFDKDLNQDSLIAIFEATDSNSDGLVDDVLNYAIYDNGKAISVSSSGGYEYSDAYTSLWDVVGAVKVTNGYQLLLEGGSVFEGQYHVWDADQSGTIIGGSGWKSEAEALAMGLEELFQQDINDDNIIGQNVPKDSNSDGLVDDVLNYAIYDNGKAISVSSSGGYEYSDAYTSLWDVVGAVKVTNGYQLLLEGGSVFEGQYHVWDVDQSGTIIGGSGWKSKAEAIASGWADNFGSVLI